MMISNMYYRQDRTCGINWYCSCQYFISDSWPWWIKHM